MEGLQKVLCGMGDERAYENQWNTCNNAFFPLNKHRVWLKSDWTIFNIAKEMTLATKLQLCFIGRRVHLSDLLWIFSTLSTIYVWCNLKRREKIVYFWLFIDYERKLNFYHFIFQWLISYHILPLAGMMLNIESWAPFYHTENVSLKKKLCSKNKIPFSWLFAQLFHC